MTKEYKEVQRAVIPPPASDSEEASTSAEGRRKRLFTAVLAVLDAVLSLIPAKISIRPAAAATSPYQVRPASRR